MPHMLAPRRRCLGYSKVYCDVRKRWFLVWNQNRHITYYTLHIPYTNCEISIDLLYICSHFVWWHRPNHCATLVRICRLPFWSMPWLTYYTSTILGSFCYELRTLQIGIYTDWLVLHSCITWSKLSNNIEDSQ